MRLRFLVPSAMLCLASLASAGTITVGPALSSPDFTKLDAAVAAAAPGDVILVDPGQYIYTGTIVIDKPLTILGAGSGVVSAASSASIPVPTFEVRDLAFDESVRIVGMSLQGFGFSSGNATSFLANDCFGSVTLSDVVALSGATGFADQGRCSVRNVRAFFMEDCVFEGDPFVTSAVQLGQAGVYLLNTTAHISDSVISGSDSFHAFNQMTGGSGIIASNSVVRLSGSTISGGFGGAGFQPFVGDGGAAILAIDQSSVFVRGGGGAALVGGAGAESVFPGGDPHGIGGSALALGPGSIATTTPDVLLTPGAHGDGVSITPIVVGPGTYGAVPQALATLSLAPHAAASGESVTFDFAGNAGDVYLPFVSANVVPAYEVPGVFGAVVLDLNALIPLPNQVLDAMGNAQLVIEMPVNPALVGMTFLAQGYSFGAGGLASVSNPSLIGIK